MTGVPEIVGAREYTAAEVCAVLRISRASLRRYRQAGIVVPVSPRPDAPATGGERGERYDEQALLRLRTAHRLVRDLSVNLAGAEVALHLLDQLAALHAELERVQARLAARSRD